MADDTHESNTPGADNAAEPRRRGRGRDGGEDKLERPDPKKLRFRTLIPSTTNIDFIGTRWWGIGICLFAIFLVFASMVYNRVTTGSALNYGIDFQGGSSVRLELTHEADLEQLRALLEEEGYPGSSVVAVPDAENEVMIRTKKVLSITPEDVEACREALVTGLPAGVSLAEDGFSHPESSSKIFLKFTAQPAYSDVERLLGDAGCEGTASAGTGKPEEFPVEFALIGVGNDITQVIDERLGAGTVATIVTSETVGAKVGNQLKLDGVKATVIAICFIFLYVMVRFDLRFAPGGIIALIHDAIIVVGAYSLTGREFNLQSIAAILTIVGYSINDTIVVFDRIRERVALFRDDPIEKTVNTSLNETLSRTLLTAGTTLLVVLSTLLVGSGAIKDFAFALTVGLVAGTISSLYIASPVFLWINDRFYKGKGHLLELEKAAAGERGTGTLLGEEEIKSQVEREAGDEPNALEVGSSGRSIGEGESSGEEADGDDEPSPGEGERKTRRRRRRPQA